MIYGTLPILPLCGLSLKVHAQDYKFHLLKCEICLQRGSTLPTARSKVDGLSRQVTFRLKYYTVEIESSQEPL